MYILSSVEHARIFGGIHGTVEAFLHLSGIMLHTKGSHNTAVCMNIESAYKFAEMYLFMCVPCYVLFSFELEVTKLLHNTV